MRRPAGLRQPRRPPRRCEPYRSHNARNGIVVSTDRSVSSRPMSAIALLNLASATFQAHRRPRPASAHPRFGLSVKQDVAICARLTAAASAAPPGQSASEAAAGQLSRLLAGLPEPAVERERRARQRVAPKARRLLQRQRAGRSGRSTVVVAGVPRGIVRPPERCDVDGRSIRTRARSWCRCSVPSSFWLLVELPVPASVSARAASCAPTSFHGGGRVRAR